MRLLDHKRPLTRIVLFLVLFLTAVLSSSTQTSPTIAPEPAFLAYKCEFQAETNSARIRAVLTGSDGLPIPRNAYTVSVSATATGEVLPPERVTTTIVETRPPLRMMLVIDATDTVPISNIVNALRNELAPRLQVLDEVALVTFGQQIFTYTEFYYTDKNRLINDHLSNLKTSSGDNRVYDAILRGVIDLPLDSNLRQVVLVITDSGRRDEEQTTIDRIIEEANEKNVQVFNIGYYTRDKPDHEELTTIANETEGYVWIYANEQNTRASIEAAMNEYLEALVEALDSEILLTVDMHGQEPDANGRVLFDLAVTASDAPLLSTQIGCPVENLNHEIRFFEGLKDEIDGITTTTPIDFEVTIDTPLNPEETTIVFWVDDNPVQTSESTVYSFDSPEWQPGDHTIGAQLIDRYNQVLATTDTITVSIQHILELDVYNVDGTVSSGITNIEISGNPDLELEGVIVTVTSTNDPEQSYFLSDTPLSFQNGKTSLVVEDLPTTIRTLFPDLTGGDTVQIKATVPSPSGNGPLLAESNNVTFTLAALPLPEPPRYDPEDYIPAAIILFLATLNLLLFRWVKQLRIRKIINRPDDDELSQQLMAITVRRDTGKQTHTLTKKTIFIGRGSTNDINLGDAANISRQHGIIMWRKGDWYYSNRKRRIKTRINGKWQRGFVFKRLEAVTEMEIGHVYLIFHSNAQRDLSDFMTTNL
jgi:hypothetical protein